MALEQKQEYEITNMTLLDKINDLEINQMNLTDEVREIKQDITNQIIDMKSMLMDGMHTLSKAFQMNCQGPLNLREDRVCIASKDELREIKKDITNQIRDMKSMLMDAMHTLSKAFEMNCQGTLNLREEMSEYAGTFGPDPVIISV